MSDCESVFDLDEGAELHEEEEEEGTTITCGYEDSGGETVVVGVVRDTSGSRVLSKRRKKTAKRFCIPNASLETATCVVRYLNGEDLGKTWDLPGLMELYQVAKSMEIDALVDWIVERFVELVEESEDPFGFLGIVSVPEWEEECVWVYAYI